MKDATDLISMTGRIGSNGSEGCSRLDKLITPLSWSDHHYEIHYFRGTCSKIYGGTNIFTSNGCNACI